MNQNIFDIIAQQLSAWMPYIVNHFVPKLITALGEDPIAKGINGSSGDIHQNNNNIPGPANCLTLCDLMALQRERPDTPTNTGIQLRWQLYPLEQKSMSSPYSSRRQFVSKPGVLICSRQLGGVGAERSHSRLTQSVATTEQDGDEQDIDSISTTSGGIFTPCSTVDQQKLNAMEQQLAILQKQLAQLLQNQPNGEKAAKNDDVGKKDQCSSSTAPPTAPAPPPPAPPLPPSLKLELSRASNLHKKPTTEIQKSVTPSPPPVQMPSNNNNTATTMIDILKGIENVKLKKVNRSSPRGTPGRARKQPNLENDHSLAGALARAMDERRKKLKLDSEEADEDQKEEGEGGWSDTELERMAPNGPTLAAMVNGNSSHDVENGGADDDGAFLPDGPNSI